LHKLNLFDLFVLTWIEQRVACHRVPNIKFNVAKVLQSLIPIVDQSVSTIVDISTLFLKTLLLFISKDLIITFHFVIFMEVLNSLIKYIHNLP